MYGHGLIWDFMSISMSISSSVAINKIPWSPKVEPWVNRWTFSPPPSPSHHQIFVSLRYRKCQFSNLFDFPGNSSDSYLFLLLLLLFPGVFLSGELSTSVRRTVHRLQAVLLIFSTIQPWAGYITGGHGPSLYVLLYVQIVHINLCCSVYVQMYIVPGCSSCKYCIIFTNKPPAIKCCKYL